MAKTKAQLEAEIERLSRILEDRRIKMDIDSRTIEKLERQNFELKVRVDGYHHLINKLKEPQYVKIWETVKFLFKVAKVEFVTNNLDDCGITEARARLKLFYANSEWDERVDSMRDRQVYAILRSISRRELIM